MELPRKEIKRVVLTYPNQKWMKHDFNTTRILPPYAICILATMIKEDYEVKIVDANLYNMSKEQFQEEIREFKPQVVGISVLTSEYGSTLDDAASYVKEIDQEIITIAGGVHVTTQYMDVIKNVDIDYAIRGEGEYVLRDLLKYINDKGEFLEKDWCIEIMKVKQLLCFQSLFKTWMHCRFRIMIWLIIKHIQLRKLEQG